jgi:mitosis inhibitor protein kinase SWE1
MASTWPAPPHIEGEGDRLYLSEEAMNGRYDKPCDIFALGIIMCEAATNHTLPENGGPWQRLRRGDLSDLPSLTWSSESSLDRDVNGDPIDLETGNASIESLWMSDGEDEPMGRISIPSVQRYSGGLSQPPPFMMDDKHQDSLQQLVTWMCDYNPDMRPTAEQVYLSYGCQWVERRSRAGATIFEGNWGPADDVLDLDHKVEEVDRMDTD